MSRLRLAPKVEQYVAAWKANASREDRERIAQVLETMADGSWLGRWFPDEEDCEYLPAPAWTKFWPDELVQFNWLVETIRQLKPIGDWRISEVPLISTEVAPVIL